MKLKELLCNRHFQLGAVIVILGLVPIFVNNASSVTLMWFAWM